MVKVFTKKIIVFLLLIMLAIYFCGCAQVRAMTITNDDGSVEEQVYVSLDAKAVFEAGYDLLDLKQDISATALSEANQMIENLNLKVINDLQNATEETQQELKKYYNGIDVLSNNWKNNEYVVSIKFKNIDVYKYYYNISENAKAETKTEKHFFYNKISFAGSTMYIKHHELYQRTKNLFSLHYFNLIDSESNELLYTYTTDLRRQHSNADYVTYQDGKYYHTWVVEDVENTEILFHYNIANSGNWILLAIGISLVACGIMFGFYFILKNLKKELQITE